MTVLGLTGCEINGRSAPSLNASVNDPNLEIECSWDGEFGSITEAKFFVPLATSTGIGIRRVSEMARWIST